MNPLLNPQIFPPVLSKNDHSRLIKTGVAAVVLLTIIAIIYYVSSVLSKQTQIPEIIIKSLEPEIPIRQKVINELKAVYTTITDIQRATITKELNQTKTKVATSTKAAVINRLK